MVWSLVFEVSAKPGIIHRKVMEVTPQMDRDNYKKMKNSLQAFSKKRSLQKMSKYELSNMSKEVILACAADEIALVWEKLPEHLQNDIDILKYQYCQDHHNTSSNGYSCDTVDGPPPRRIFCCYCQVRDVNVTNNNSGRTLSTNRQQSHLSRHFCCRQQ